MNEIKKNDLVRVNINIPVNVLERVKAYANEIGIPVTQAYIVLINSGLEQRELVSKMPKLLEMMGDIFALAREHEEDIFTD